MIACLALTGVVSANKDVLEPGCFREVCGRSQQGEQVWVTLGHPAHEKSALEQSRAWVGFVSDLQEIESKSGVGELWGDVHVHLAAQLTKQIGSRIVSGELKFSIGPLVTDTWTDEFGIKHYTKVDRLVHVALVPTGAFPTYILRSA